LDAARGTSVIIASVVVISEALLAASTSAVRTTWLGVRVRVRVRVGVRVRVRVRVRVGGWVRVTVTVTVGVGVLPWSGR
jgi:hypothetical protein